MNCLRFCLVLVVAIFGVVSPAFAQHGVEAAGALLSTKSLGGFSLGLAAFGGAMGQARVMSSALDGISRNPGAAGSMFQPWFLGLVFIESLVLFTMVVATKLAGIW